LSVYKPSLFFCIEDTCSESHWETFKICFGLVTDSIFSSARFFPPQIRDIFKLIEEETRKKFDETACLLAVNGFLFLRFFVPLIRSPVENSLLKENLSQNQADFFANLAACIQKVANLSVFRDNEPLSAFNTLIVEKVPPMKKYVQQIMEGEPSNYHYEPQNIQVERDLAMIIHRCKQNSSLLMKFQDTKPAIAKFISLNLM